jgi:hypothetical protein
MDKMEDRVPSVTLAQQDPLALMVPQGELAPKEKRARADLRAKRVPMAPLAERALRVWSAPVEILATSATPVLLARPVLRARPVLVVIRVRLVQLVSLVKSDA